jgi:hypothetical protein
MLLVNVAKLSDNGEINTFIILSISYLLHMHKRVLESTAQPLFFSQLARILGSFMQFLGNWKTCNLELFHV